jgi:hypothetical protein
MKSSYVIKFSPMRARGRIGETFSRKKFFVYSIDIVTIYRVMVRPRRKKTKRTSLMISPGCACICIIVSLVPRPHAEEREGLGGEIT